MSFGISLFLFLSHTHSLTHHDTNCLFLFVTSDPNHPNCLREITSLGTTATLAGTDGNPGCPVDGSGRKWELTGKIDNKDIYVDFSPKGGPKDLKGVFDGSGIKWPDGNKWSLKAQSTEAL